MVEKSIKEIDEITKSSNSYSENSTSSSSNVTVREAGIICEDFVRPLMKYPKEVEFEDNAKGELVKDNLFKVLQKFTAKNAFGVKSEYVYKIFIAYTGGDWTEKNNWVYQQIIIENVSTGEQNIYNGRNLEKEKNAADLGKVEVIAGIKCTIMFKTSDAIKYCTNKKLKNKDMKKIYMVKHEEFSTIQFCVEPNTAVGKEYASFSGKNFFNFDTGLISNVDKIK